MASNPEARPPGPPPGTARPQQLGKYRIEQRLGAGGMGTVFLAVDTELQRTVALKVLPRERAANPQLVRRFKSEGQAAARLEHENIVKVFEAGEIDGHLYLALEYVDGSDVQEIIRKRGTVPVRRSIEIVRQVAAALQHAAERNIVHRDVKPSNFLVRRDGVVKLTDMGLARALDETVETGITHAGMTVGTVDYISPEQGADSKQADIRSDLYSLGCSWYHMLTGEVPYPEGSAFDKLRCHATAPIPDPRRINDRVPAPVVAVLQRLMAKRPQDRYQTPQELLHDLDQPHLLRQEFGAASLASLASSAADADPEPADAEPPSSVLFAEIEAASDSGEHAAEPVPDTEIAPGRAGRRRRPAAAARANGRRTDRPGRAPRGTTSPTRELPPREKRPERFAVSQSSIDPALLKLGAFVLFAAAVLAAVGWGAYRLSNSGRDADHLAEPIPLPQRTPDAPPPPVQPAPQLDRPAPQVPPTTLADFQPQSPFPGVEDARENASIEDVPAWVYELRTVTPNTPRTLVVDPHAEPGNAFANLRAALGDLAGASGVIEFRGRGPHVVDGFNVAAAQHLVLRAAAGQQPVLVLTGANGDRTGSIAVRGGRLELDGLHVVAAGRDRAATQPLLRLESATALVRNCSFTLAPPVAEPVAAIELAPAVRGNPSRCVVENVILRGDNLSAFALTEGAHQLVAGNCLIVSGSAPAVSVTSPPADPSAPDALPASLQLLASAVFSRRAAFRLEHPDARVRPALRLRLRSTALVAESNDAVAVDLAHWPESAPGDLDQPRALGIELVAERALWCRWPCLTHFQPPSGEPVVVADEAAWLQFWRTPPGSSLRDAAPVSTPPLDPASTAPESALSRLHEMIPEAGAAPASFCDASRFHEIPESLVARIVADSARPRIPDDFDTAFSGEAVRIDLARNGLKLDRLLNECPDGARVILAGKGRVEIEPVVLRGKTLRVEFDGGDEPLIVEPVRRSGSDRPPALFRVEQGRLDLIGGILRIPSSETSALPLRLLQVAGGSFAVRRCLLLGQFGAGARDVPVIEWTATAAGGDQFGLIEDSYITGPHQAVRAELDGRLLELRNCVVFSLGDGLRLGAGGHDGTLHLADCTLSSSAAFFRIEPPGGQEAPGRLHVFVERAVYGPPAASTDTPVLLVHHESSGRNAVLHWWETATAYSDRITRFRAADDSSGAPQQFEDWLRGWGPDHVERALWGPVAVIPASPLPEPAKTRPEDFRLADAAQAATAGPDGRPLGARVDDVGPSESPPPSRTTPTPEPRRRTQPAF